MTPFSEKLDLVLKALSMSRGRLAADLGVDKSLVGRWASGAVTPSPHNLENLTRLIAGRREGFTMLDWDRELDSLAGVFGVEARGSAMRAVGNGSAQGGLPLPLLEMARQTTARRGAAYEGFWRTSRASMVMPGRFFHDHGMIRRTADGLLGVTMGGSGMLFEGWMLPAEGQLFVIITDTVGQTPIFLILNGVPLPRAELLDGLVMAASLDPARTPSAYPIILERVGDLSGDIEADDARAVELMATPPLAPEGEIGEEMARHLIRDMGPTAAAAGGPLFLQSPVSNTLSRGSSAGGHLHG